jgi:hypothetical protein
LKQQKPDRWNSRMTVITSLNEKRLAGNHFGALLFGNRCVLQ